MGKENRVVVDVRRPEVGEPADFIERRGHEGVCTKRSKLRHQAGEFALTGFGRERMRENRRGGHGGTIIPDLGRKIQILAERDAFGGKEPGQPVRGSDAERTAIDPDRGAIGRVTRQPLIPAFNPRSAVLHQRDAGAFELPRGLCPVAAVSPEQRVMLRDNQRSGTPREAGEPFTVSPVRRQIFRCVGV